MPPARVRAAPSPQRVSERAEEQLNPPRACTRARRDPAAAKTRVSKPFPRPVLAGDALGAAPVATGGF